MYVKNRRGGKMENIKNKIKTMSQGGDKNKKILLLAIALLAVCLVLFVGFDLASNSSNYSVQGNLKSEEVDLNTKIAGNVQEILVAEGDTVKKGDILVVISSENIEAKKLQAEGALAAATATYDKATNGARSQEVIQAKAAADLYAKTYNRVKALYAEGAVSENEYDQVYTQYLAAQETYSMALEGARSEDVAAAEALVQQAAGAVAEVNSYLEDCKMKASMDGIVSGVNVSAGELVSTGVPLVSISNRENYWVEVNVEETQLDKVQIGKEVKVTFAAYPEEKFVGTVTSVAEKPSFATKRATNNNDGFDILSYGVKVKINKIDKSLYPGMTVNVTFED